MMIQVQLREFQPGDKVLLLVPTTEAKLLARWQRPYTVERRIGEVDYEVEMPDKRDKVKIFHVNLLNVWKERQREVYGGKTLAPLQRKERCRHRRVS